MKGALLIAAVTAVAVAGCGPTPQQKAEITADKAEAQLASQAKKLKPMMIESCRESFRGNLKDPDSLREIDTIVNFYGDDYRPAEYFDDGDLMWPEYNGDVLMDYVAANSYGGPTRGTRLCLFDHEELVFSHRTKA